MIGEAGFRTRLFLFVEIVYAPIHVCLSVLHITSKYSSRASRGEPSLNIFSFVFVWAKVFWKVLCVDFVGELDAPATKICPSGTEARASEATRPRTTRAQCRDFVSDLSPMIAFFDAII